MSINVYYIIYNLSFCVLGVYTLIIDLIISSFKLIINRSRPTYFASIELKKTMYFSIYQNLKSYDLLLFRVPCNPSRVLHPRRRSSSGNDIYLQPVDDDFSRGGIPVN